MQNAFVYNSTKFAFDWLPYSTRSLRILGSVKQGEIKSTKILGCLFINGRARVLGETDKEFNATNLNNSLVSQQNAMTMPFESLRLHPSVDAKHIEFVELLGRIDITLPTLPCHQQRTTTPKRSASVAGIIQQPSRDDAVANKSNSKHSLLCQKIKKCFELKNKLKNIRVTQIEVDTLDPGLGGGTSQIR